jgi:hypothetical protein
MINLDLASEGGVKIYGDGGEDSVGVLHVKTAAAKPAVHASRSAVGSQTIGILALGGSSMASGAIVEFKGGFISCTSVVLTSVANSDYVIPVQVGLETRYIPVFKAAAIVGGATF